MLAILPRTLATLLFLIITLPGLLLAAESSTGAAVGIDLLSKAEVDEDEVYDGSDDYIADFELANQSESQQPKKDLNKEYTRGRMAFLFGQYEAAYKIWRPLADSGYAKAQTTLGWMFHTGKGVEQDFTEAFNWYVKAAKQNQPIAQNNIGVFYEQGLGVGKSAKNAAKWYREAAEWGYSYAQYNLGMLYQQGRGVKRNGKEAQFWLQLAALQGVAQATMELQKISGNVHGGKAVTAKGPKWNKSNSTAQNGSPHQNPHSSSRYKNMAELIKNRRSHLEASDYGGSLSEITGSSSSASKSKTKTKSNAATKSAQPNSDAIEYNSTQTASKKSHLSAAELPTPKATTRDIPKDTFDKWLADARVAEMRLKQLQAEKKTNSHSLKIYNDEWVAEQDPKFYTLQLARSDELDWILNIAKKQPMLKETAYYTEIIDGKKWYYLIYGSFKNRKSANSEIENLPKALKKWSPWVRRFSQVQAKMAANVTDSETKKILNK